jgi:competence protein ComGC
MSEKRKFWLLLGLLIISVALLVTVTRIVDQAFTNSF